MGYQEKDGGVVFLSDIQTQTTTAPDGSCQSVMSRDHKSLVRSMPRSDIRKIRLVGKADRIFNVNESGFPLSWNPTMLLTRRGHKSPQAMTPGSGREQITVQTCISGSGQLMAPYVVYKGARVSP